jgi:hypothetical protein
LIGGVLDLDITDRRVSLDISVTVQNLPGLVGLSQGNRCHKEHHKQKRYNVLGAFRFHNFPPLNLFYLLSLPDRLALFANRLALGQPSSPIKIEVCRAKATIWESDVMTGEMKKLACDELEKRVKEMSDCLFLEDAMSDEFAVFSRWIRRNMQETDKTPQIEESRRLRSRAGDIPGLRTNILDSFDHVVVRRIRRLRDN